MNLRKTRLIAEILALAALIAFLLGGVYAEVQVAHTARTTQDKIAAVNVRVLNEDLYNLKRVIIHVDEAANDSQKATKHELTVLDAVNGQLIAILHDTDTNLQDLAKNQTDITQHVNKTLDATTVDIQSLDPVIAELKTDATDVHTGLTSLNTLVSNPDIPVILADTKAMGESGKSISADAAHAFHSYVYPRPIVRVVDWSIKISSAVAAWWPFHN